MAKNEWTKEFIGGMCDDDDGDENGAGRFEAPWSEDAGSPDFCTEHYGLPIAEEATSRHFLNQKYLRQGHNDVCGMGGQKGGFTGNPQEQRPEKAFPDVGYKLPEESERVTPVRIKGGGSRPF